MCSIYTDGFNYRCLVIGYLFYNPSPVFALDSLKKCNFRNEKFIEELTYNLLSLLSVNKEISNFKILLSSVFHNLVAMKTITETNKQMHYNYIWDSIIFGEVKCEMYSF